MYENCKIFPFFDVMMTAQQNIIKQLLNLIYVWCTGS